MGLYLNFFGPKIHYKEIIKNQSNGPLSENYRQHVTMANFGFKIYYSNALTG